MLRRDAPAEHQPPQAEVPRFRAVRTVRLPVTATVCRNNYWQKCRPVRPCVPPSRIDLALLYGQSLSRRYEIVAMHSQLFFYFPPTILTGADTSAQAPSKRVLCRPATLRRSQLRTSFDLFSLLFLVLNMRSMAKDVLGAERGGHLAPSDIFSHIEQSRWVCRPYPSPWTRDFKFSH